MSSYLKVKLDPIYSVHQNSLTGGAFCACERLFMVALAETLIKNDGVIQKMYKAVSQLS